MSDFLDDQVREVHSSEYCNSQICPMAVSLFFRDSSKKGGCAPEALRLREKDGNQGTVYWVYQFCHAYYVPKLSEKTDFALNQADNGFEGFPALTVQDVESWGERLDRRNMWDILLK